ncbi:MAG: hypothetical protein CL930_06940 [Deltaproteobacteria bacterium]|nr:hypothetical protein [Deltaproteobacteria bacterium]
MKDPSLPARRAFLSARWERLCLVTYAVDPARLEPLLPPDLQLDTRDGKAFVSLVAFDFLDTRVLGVPWPGYRNFPEVNLRFYVRHGDQRGVVFIREYVPKKLIAWLARGLYNEPYKAAPMRSTWSENEQGAEIAHELIVGGQAHTLKMSLGATATTPPEDSTAHFFKEHSWGFGHSHRGNLLRYEVWHPIWQTRSVESLDLQWDFGCVYGPEWSDLNESTPYHTAFALGSEIRVYPKTLPI